MVIGEIVVDDSTNKDSMAFVEVTPEYLLLKFPLGHQTVNNPILLSIEGVRTPRSFRPSSEFVIQTMSVEEYIIDAGGSDITVTMSKMNEISDVNLFIADLTNGAVTDYEFTLDTFVYLKDLDRVLFTIPPQVGFGENGI